MILWWRRHPEPAPLSHAPTVTTESQVTVTCAATGREYRCGYSYIRSNTLADVEEWCRELRRQGGGDDLDLTEANGLTVTLDRAV